MTLFPYTTLFRSTLGDIEGDMLKKQIIVHRFGHPEEIIDTTITDPSLAGHGGGDGGLMEQFCDLVANGGTNALTSIDASVESHVMALAAEASRLQGGKTIELAEFEK